MSGSGGESGGQQVSGRQSPAGTQPALNGKPTAESTGSKPGGGSSVSGPATSARVYLAKPPGRSRATVTTRGAASVPGETETTPTRVPGEPPVTFTDDGPSETSRASFSRVTE